MSSWEKTIVPSNFVTHGESKMKREMIIIKVLHKTFRFSLETTSFGLLASFIFATTQSTKIHPFGWNNYQCQLAGSPTLNWENIKRTGKYFRSVWLFQVLVSPGIRQFVGCSFVSHGNLDSGWETLLRHLTRGLKEGTAMTTTEGIPAESTIHVGDVRNL